MDPDPARIKVGLHPHAKARLHERGATEDEVIATIVRGERFSVKHGRTGFRCNFPFDGEWNNRRYPTKQVEAYAVEEEDGWLVITVIVKFF
jgi:nitrite reductase/ring-hydroxylating ferredoxin subunit